MKKILVLSLILFAIFLSGCQKTMSSLTNGANNSSANTPNNVSTPAANKEVANTPATEKVDNDFVQSESGAEKAKPDAGKANVQGKVLFDSKPVAGIDVELCEKFNQYFGGCGGEMFKTKTDANGEYFIANITPRVYEGLLARVFNTKLYIFATRSYGISGAKYKIDADKTFFAPDTNLFKDDLKVQAPKTGSKVDVKTLEVKWDAYPDAAYYKINLSPKEYNYESSVVDEKVEGTSYKTEKTLVNDEYTLKISAYNANDVKLADSGENNKFNLTGAATSANTNTK